MIILFFRYFQVFTRRLAIHQRSFEWKWNSFASAKYNFWDAYTHTGALCGVCIYIFHHHHHKQVFPLPFFHPHQLFLVFGVCMLFFFLLYSCVIFEWPVEFSRSGTTPSLSSPPPPSCVTYWPTDLATYFGSMMNRLAEKLKVDQ